MTLYVIPSLSILNIWECGRLTAPERELQKFLF